VITVGTRSAGELFVLSHASPNARLTAIRERFEKHAESLSVSVMTAAELRFGAAKAARPKLAELVEAYLERLAILDWTNEVTGHYARIRRSGIWFFLLRHTRYPSEWCWSRITSSNSRTFPVSRWKSGVDLMASDFSIVDFNFLH
jgi:hypothetical protein